MKLEPVYVVAPRPQPSALSSRRALLIGGLSFVGGAIVGAACGYSAGATTAATPSTPAGPADETLAWLRKLASPATPIAELAKHHRDLVLHISWHYPEDQVLWEGVARLVEAVITDPNVTDRYEVALGLRGLITASAKAPQALKGRLPELRGIRR